MQPTVKIISPVSLSQLPRRQIFTTLAGVMLAMFLSSLDQTIVGTAMPRIITDLGGFSQYTWVTTAYIITSAITIPITGKLIDTYGRKWFYITGITIFLVGSILSGFSLNMTHLIFSRGFQGIGAGIMMANAFTVIADLFPPAERGKYQGYMSGIFGLSSVIGPTLGGFLTDSISWHWVFWVNIPLGIIIIFLFIRFFPDIRPDNLKHNIDFFGVTALILSVVPALLALTWGGTEYPWNSVVIIGMFIFALTMAILFILIESRAREPVIPLYLFKNNIVTISIIATFLTSIGMFSSVTFLPLYFQGILGASAVQSGNLLIPMMLGVLIGSIVGGQLLSRAGGHYRILSAAGIAIMCVGIFLLSRMTEHTSYTTAVFYMIITGLGLGPTMPVFTIAVQNAVSQKMLGVATSATAFFRSIGGSVGLALLGSVMANRFTVEMVNNIPEAVKNVLPGDQLTSLANNPQALVSPDAQANMQQMFSQLGDPSLFSQFIEGLRHALSIALSNVFLFALIICLLSLIMALFLKEIPLRKSNIAQIIPQEGQPAGKQAD